MSEVLQERLVGVRQDIVRVESEIRHLAEMFDKSATKQGERIGLLEQGMLERKVDFRWAMRVGFGVWAVAQGMMISAFGYWLNHAENQRADQQKQEYAALRRDALDEVGEIRAGLKAMGIDIESGALQAPVVKRRKP